MCEWEFTLFNPNTPRSPDVHYDMHNFTKEEKDCPILTMKGKGTWWAGRQVYRDNQMISTHNGNH